MVSIDDIQEILDGLDTALKVTRGTYEVKYRGQTIKIDARKYFENVDGIEKFLPYYEFDGSDLASFNFTDKSGKKTASLLDFMDGTLSFLDDGEEYIVFRDPSFEISSFSRTPLSLFNPLSRMQSLLRLHFKPANFPIQDEF